MPSRGIAASTTIPFLAGNPSRSKVDLFHGDFTPYHASEIEILKKTISAQAKSK